MQEWIYLGQEKVSCLERCPRFMGLVELNINTPDYWYGEAVV